MYDAEVVVGDALDVLRATTGAFDVVLTDPPYSSGTRREAAKGIRKSMLRGLVDNEDDDWFASDQLTANAFAFLMRSCAIEWQRLLVPGGHALVFIDWRMMPLLAASIESADLRHAGMIVWDKVDLGMGNTFRNRYELILHFSKGVAQPPRRRDVGNVIVCRADPVAKRPHPTAKPVGLLQRLLSVVAPEGGRVLDPFMGAGSTGVAAILEGLSFVGIERDAQYAVVARQRFERAAEMIAA